MKVRDTVDGENNVEMDIVEDDDEVVNKVQFSENLIFEPKQESAGYLLSTSTAYGLKYVLGLVCEKVTPFETFTFLLQLRVCIVFLHRNTPVSSNRSACCLLS